MGVPKRKHSRARRDKRWAHYHLRPRPLSICPRCGERKLPHRVCPSCGFYGVKKVINVKD